MIKSIILAIVVGLVILGGGIYLGQYSADTSVPLLPTRIPATPENYLAQMNATPEPYFGTTIDEIGATPMPKLSGDLAKGQLMYEQQCAHCHGMVGQGEPGAPNPNIPDAYGFMRVPRHDSAGHTWHHPDQLLLEFIKSGSQNRLYRQVMPPYGEFWTDEEIMLVLDYIKLWWTSEQLEQQAAATERLRIAREQQ